MLIVQLRGTSGSGKSTAVRKFMAGYSWEPHHVDKRRKPLYYLLLPSRSVCILGHYEVNPKTNSSFGGCDSITSGIQTVCEILKSLPPSVEAVVMEGVMIGEDVKWSITMGELRVLFLTTPIGTCMERIQVRREGREARTGKGRDKSLNTERTVSRAAAIERVRQRLDGLGVWTRRCSADQSSRLMTQLLMPETVEHG